MTSFNSKLYSMFSINDLKNPFQLAIKSLMPQIIRQLLYINASIHIYIHVKDLKLQFFCSVNTFQNLLTHQTNRLGPATVLA